MPRETAEQKRRRTAAAKKKEPQFQEELDNSFAHLAQLRVQQRDLIDQRTLIDQQLEQLRDSRSAVEGRITVLQELRGERPALPPAAALPGPPPEEPVEEEADGGR
jgi:small-conductance mechanosensitive channel